MEKATKEGMTKKDVVKLSLALLISAALVVLLCLFSFLAADGYAGLPVYDEKSVHDLVLLLDGESWEVSSEARAGLEKLFLIEDAKSLETGRSATGIDVVIYTARSPFVLSTSYSGKRLEGVFAQKGFSIVLLYEDGEPVLGIYDSDMDELVEFRQL